MKKGIKIVFFISLVAMMFSIGYKIVKQGRDEEVVEVIVNKPFSQLINMKEEVFQEEIFILPEEIQIKVNDEIVKDRVEWDKVAVTDTPGKYMYEGYTLNNNYCINLILNVKENVYDRKVGYVRNIYLNDKNQGVIEFDIVEFYKGEDALYEAVKDNEIVIEDYCAYENSFNYYIRNAAVDKQVFKINGFPIYELVDMEINDEQKGSMELVKVDFERLKQYVDNFNNCDDEEKLLFCIDLKNDEVVSMVRQYLKYN